MLVEILLVLHIAVLGFWLGAELAINTTYRYVTRGSAMPFAERDRLMSHVMNMDQYVRFALISQLALGSGLTVLTGYLPGGAVAAMVVTVFCVGWLTLVEVTHRRRNRPEGPGLARLDRGVRYLIIFALAIVGAGMGLNLLPAPGWLGWKLLLFAGVSACGLALRFCLIAFYRTWRVMEVEGSSDDREFEIQQVYTRATSILVVLWLQIAAIVVLSVWKPG